MCPLGHIETRALPYQHYTLVFTPGLLAAYKRSLEGQVENLIPDPAALLGQEGGYLASDTLAARGLFPASDAPGWWWAPSGLLGYSPNPSDTPAAELAHANTHFFQPHRFTDPYTNTTTVSYDNYDLLVTESRAPLDNRITAGTRTSTGAVNGDGLDYRVLAPD